MKATVICLSCMLLAGVALLLRPHRASVAMNPVDGGHAGVGVVHRSDTAGTDEEGTAAMAGAGPKVTRSRDRQAGGSARSAGMVEEARAGGEAPGGSSNSERSPRINPGSRNSASLAGGVEEVAAAGEERDLSAAGAMRNDLSNPRMPLVMTLPPEQVHEMVPQIPAEAVKQMQDDFLSKIGGSTMDPDDPTYARAWADAESDLERHIRVFYGWTAWSNYERQLALQAKYQQPVDATSAAAH